MTKVTFAVTSPNGSKFEVEKRFENAEEGATFFRFARDAEAQGFSFTVVSVDAVRN